MGIKMGSSRLMVTETLDSLASVGTIRKLEYIECPEGTDSYYSTNKKYLTDKRRVIDAFPITGLASFTCVLSFKEGEKYRETDVSCIMGFFKDSLYTVYLTPELWRGLEHENVLQTYSDKYGDLSYNEHFPKAYSIRTPWLGGPNNDTIYEVTDISADNTLWRFKDVEIYVSQMTEYETEYHYDSADIRRIWTDLILYSQEKRIQAIKERLYGQKLFKTHLRSFVAYKYMPIHLQESLRREQQAQISRQEAMQRQEAEENARNEAAENLSNKQDI
jgi:hypothetical protein